ncbi:MAG TPA: hypothetical protein VG759_01255 [Candidatus Angelobacter sp.]|jgi:hypothetical protein|nr:hypothetical protein [Candidatus Angelobacter sp.]
MRNNFFKHQFVTKANDPANVVDSMTIPAQNFKSNQFRKANLFRVIVLPNLVAMRILITITRTTAAINFDERIFSNLIPPFVFLENVMRASMKQWGGD